MSEGRAQGYVFGDRPVDAEAVRLDLLEETFEVATQRRLHRLGLPWSGRFLEVGAGRGATAMFMLGRCGLGGEVVATDIDVRWLDEIRHPNLRVIRHDIVHDELDELGTFDVVHGRFLLQHLGRNVDDAVVRMVSLVRPGGYLLIEDSLTNDHVDPGHPDADMMTRGSRAFGEFFVRYGVDRDTALPLPRRLRELGLVEVGNEIVGAVRHGDDVFSRFLARSIEATASRVPYDDIYEVGLNGVLERFADSSFYYTAWHQLAVWGTKA